MQALEESTGLRVRVGCEFTYSSALPTPAVFLVRPESTGPHRVIEERWTTSPGVDFYDYHDLYGNACRRLTLPPGLLTLGYDAFVETPDIADPTDWNALQHDASALPDDVLLYTLPSRYCLSDVMSDRAWELFGNVPRGWGAVQTICDWVHAHITFAYGTSTRVTTALDVYERGVGVCRDFTHLGITFCRALNIPARYVFGYIPDIEVPPPTSPMDFCAWFEAYLGGRWWTFDPRNNQRRKGRIPIARGRDALDVAMVTTYGAPVLERMTVWADDTRLQGVPTG
ncbi:MAG TPA: transglutaminase family protein [Candidatus Baltobacteraceae bacterium]